MSRRAAQVGRRLVRPPRGGSSVPSRSPLSASPPRGLSTLQRASGVATEAPRRGEPPPDSGVAPGDRAPERRRRRGGEGAARDGSCLARRARSSPELWLARRCVWAGDSGVAAAAAARQAEMGTEAGEGITFSVPPFASTGFCTIREGGSCRRGVGAATAAAEGEPSLQPLLVPPPPPPPPGSFWNVESAAAPATSCPTAAPGSSATRGRGNSGSGGGRRTTVAYVINEASQGQLVVAESEALQSLREACEAVGATLETLHFGKLDFGETTVLDRFYNAGEWQLLAVLFGFPLAVFVGENFLFCFVFRGREASFLFTSRPTLGAARGVAGLFMPAAPSRGCAGARDCL